MVEFVQTRNVNVSMCMTCKQNQDWNILRIEISFSLILKHTKYGIKIACYNQRMHLWGYMYRILKIEYLHNKVQVMCPAFSNQLSLYTPQVNITSYLKEQFTNLYTTALLISHYGYEFITQTKSKFNLSNVLYKG